MKHVILISGKLQSGKNQFAEYIKELLGDESISVGTDLYAKSLKDGCREDYAQLAEFMKSHTDAIKTQINVFMDVRGNPARHSVVDSLEKMLNDITIVDDNWYENKNKLTRILLQTYGTDIFRKRVNDDWWAKQLFDRVIKSNKEFTLITDVRFPNEIDIFDNAPDDIMVHTVRIDRNTNTPSDIAMHESETALDNYSNWNYVIDNNGSLQQLKCSAMTMLEDIMYVAVGAFLYD